MDKRPIKSKKRYFISFLIGTFIFLLVFFFTYSLSYLEFQRISKLQLDSTYNIFEDKLDVSFFNQDICSIEVLDKVSEDLHFQGKIIDDLEQKLGKNNQAVLARKKFYNLIELEHLEFVNSINENCNLKINTVLFFYSNEKENLDKSEDMGRLLDILYERNEKVIIYSFDSSLDSNLIRKLKTKFDIDKPITVFINDVCKFENLVSLKELENCLN